MQDKNYFNLTNPQKSIWYTEEVFKGSTINNVCTSGIIYEKIDEDLLKKAINLVVKQNDSFRIRVVLKDGSVKQYISDFKEINIDIQYINTSSELEQIEAEEAKHHFNILDSDLFKFKIVILKNTFACVILTVNHIISDSWSMGIVIQEILRNYHCLINNESTDFNAFSYIDYINSEKAYKESLKYEKDKNYWNKIFETIPEQATIPGSVQKSNVSSYSAKRLCFDINKNIVNKISTFCKESHFSIFNFFMAIFSTYISRVSSAEDFVIGTPILNRTNLKEKHTIGMFVNTAPIRVNNLNSGSFKDLANSFSQKMMGVLRHQRYSYNNILEDLRAKNENVPNLYNILISYQVTKAFDEKFGNYKTNWTFNNCCPNDMQIHISDINDTGNLLISYDYSTNKYTSKDIENLHTRIVYIINQVLNKNEILTNEIEIVTEEEKNKILYEFNNTDANYPKDKTIVDLFEEQVEKTPNNIAVVYEDKKFTYKELNEKANSLARHLIALGIKHKDVVGIRIDKSLEMVIGILAIIKAGCCYLPINMQYPRERIEFMLSNSKAKILLGTPNSLDEFNLDIKKLDISLSEKELYSHSTENLKIKMSPEDLIYIIYTSGTTGTPKGAMLCHRNVVRLIKNDKFLFDFNDKDVWPLFHSVAFDVSVWEMYGAFLYGGKLVVVPDVVAKDPNMFLSLIDKEQVTVLCQTPTYFYNLSNCEVNAVHPNLKVRYIIFAGEALKTNLLLPWHQLHPDTKLINMYGITEITVHGTFKELSEEDLKKPASDIGVPLPTLKMFILDKNLKLVPLGVPGEICVSGDGVFKGYLNRPELNEKKLVPNPYNKKELLYRSADLGVLTEKGVLEFLGRIDTQVKIRGFRVELSEIEEKICAFPNIKSCTVTTKQADGTHDLICAYYISKAPINISDLRNSLEHKLPEYMIPQYFIEVKEWPYNVNGKIDKKRLPEPQYQSYKEEIILPRNDTDKKLIKILKELININEISIEDSFFNIGGDSLIAINLCMKVQEVFGTQIYVKDILDHTIIRDLSDFIAKNTPIMQKQVIPKIPEAKYYHISSAQKRIYFASKVANDSILYNIPGGLLLDGNINIPKLEKCLKELINKNESLRTYFEVVNNNVVQKISNNVDFKLDVLKNASFENLNNICKTFIKPFDLSKAPLFRAKLIEFTNGKYALLIDMHHIISDGTSLSILTEELTKLYNGLSLDEQKITYKDFATFEVSSITSGKFQEAEQYWLKQFEGEIPILNMPTTYLRPAVQSFEGKKVHTSIDKNSLAKIELLSAKLGVTPYMLLLGCYYILLYKYTSQDDIIVGTPVVGRELPEIAEVVGMFVNTLALRNNINSKLSFKDFVLQLKENLLESYKYQSYPFDELVNKLDIKRDTSRNPLFDTMFIYQNDGYKNLDFEGINCEYFIPDTNISKFDLSLEVIPKKDEMSISFEYATSLFDEEFIKNLSEHYLNILNKVLETTDIKISEIDMLSEEEKNKILFDFNSTKMDYPKDKTIVDLFEEQVEKTPNNIAVVFEGKKLTYKELNEKANSLANYLLILGVNKGSCVPVMMDRTPELVISMLAIIKLGAIYIPIMAETPNERVKYILQDTNAKHIITNMQIADFNVQTININNFDFSKYDNQNLRFYITTSALLYIIYTSGSTGNPKGVQVCHSNLANFIYSFTNLYGDISAEDKLLASTNISFDVSIFELFMPLLNGFTLHLYTEPYINDIQKYCKALVDNKITFAYIPPNILELVYSQLASYTNISLSKLLLGVEPIKNSVVKKYYLLNPNLKIINAYGPTETTICATAVLLNENIINSSKIIPIGKPLKNLKIFILDKDLQPVPIGVSGEIYITGDNVSKGYLNNLGLTKKAFVSIPNLNCKLAYKTGDLATWDNNGIIHFIGRNDNQIKINGYRIELNEIESLILKYPNIKKVTILKQTVENREFLSAYFVAKGKIIIPELRKYLADFLPRYMVPSYYIALDKLPYTANGKVDRKALPLPTEILAINKQDYIPPTTALQKQLVSIWEKLLKTKRIGVNDNFFELGGDSILVMNLIVELLKITNNLTYQDIFKYPTIAELEQKILSGDDSPIFHKIENLSDSFTDILKNTTKLNKAKKWHPKNILLTGSTGFLGIHILEQLIKNEKGNIYCIVRESKKLTSRAKLYQKLNYYFGNKYNDLIDKRIFAITGDITKPGFGLPQDEILKIANSVDLVINSAANVSHFGNYNSFYNTNVTSVKYMVDFCNSFNKKFYHISTLSTSGLNLDLSYPAFSKNKNIVFQESSLYVGQVLDDIYSRTKFEAEAYILKAISQGLNGYILRMGNLMPRQKDGFFQENLLDNDFINKIVSFIKIGVVPDYLSNYTLNFTPIDQAAKAVYKILTHPNNTNRIFHIYNPNNISADKLIKKLAYNIEVLPEDAFKSNIEAILEDDEKKDFIKNLLDDFDNHLHLKYNSDIIIKSDFTIKYLKKSHFKWHKISNKYLRRFINLLRMVI